MRVLLTAGVATTLIVLLLACMPIQPLTPTPDPEQPTDGSLSVTATVTVTGTVPLTDTSPLTDTAPLTGTVTPTATMPISATVTPTSTVVPTTTVVPTETVSPTGTPVEETPTATSQPSVTPTTPPTATPVPTNTPAPTATFTPGPPPTATPLPATVFARNHRSYRDGADMIVVGEAVNGSAAPVYGVKTIVTFFDGGNRLVGAQESTAYLPQTLPTQANPFKVRLVDAPSTVSHYEVNLTWGDLSVMSYDRATITREDVQQGDDGVSITGEVRNDHLMELRGLVVAVTLYDDSGTVVDVLTGATGVATLPPGESTTFEAHSTRPLTFASHLVQVEGMMLR